jgi:hypothetical protein
MIAGDQFFLSNQETIFRGVIITWPPVRPRGTMVIFWTLSNVSIQADDGVAGFMIGAGPPFVLV